jgi:hypothetical protein
MRWGCARQGLDQGRGVVGGALTVVEREQIVAAVRTGKTGGALGMRFFEEPYELKTGEPEDAAWGLVDRMRVNRAEFYRRLAKGVDGIEEEAREFEFNARSPEEAAELCDIVDYVINRPTSEQEYRNGIRDKGRGGVRPSFFTSHSTAQKARLSEEEVFSLRIYTTMAFMYVNNALRDDERYDRCTPAPLPVISFYATEAIKKLRALQARSEKRQAVLWRGMRLLRASEAFMRQGGTELAFMSTTPDLAVAMRYSLSRQSLLFKIVAPSFMSLGVETEWLSAFPGEAEVVFPPLTYLQPTGRTDRVDAVDGDGNPVTINVVEVIPYMA